MKPIPPFFSVIIPVYNAEKYVERCISSLMRQSLPCNEIEIICIDDASTDGSLDLLKNLAKKYENIRVIAQSENKRQGAARNEGLAVATGKYVLFLDADDLYEDNALKELKEELSDRGELDMLIFDFILSSYDKNNSAEKFRHTSSNNSLICMTGKEYYKVNDIPWIVTSSCFNRSFLKRNKLCFVEKVRFEDVDFEINAIRLAHRVAYSPISVCNRILSKNQTTKIGSDERKIEEYFQAADRIMKIACQEEDSEVSDIIFHHYAFTYKMILLRYWYRLSFRSRKRLLERHPWNESRNGRIPTPFATRVITKFPFLCNMAVLIFRPIIYLARFVYISLRNTITNKQHRN